MKSNSDSLRKVASEKASSVTSSTRMRMLGHGRLRKPQQKNPTSILFQRQNMRVVEDNVDVTPKPLVHSLFLGIEEKQLTAFEAIGLSLSASNSQLFGSGSAHAGLKATSSMMIRSSSMQAMPYEDSISGSLLSSTLSSQVLGEDRAPSQYCLPRYDSGTLNVPPSKVIITLKETETFFIFEMPQLTEDLRTPEGVAVREANERYEYITVGPGSNRKLATAETQTPCVHKKTRGTYLGRHKRKNQGTFVNNWVMHDVYQSLSLKKEMGGIVYQTAEYANQDSHEEEEFMKFPKVQANLDNASVEDQLIRIFKHTKFRNAVQIIGRIIASNVYIVAQKRFKGLIKQDSCSLDLKFNYNLDLLWSHTCPAVQGRPVSCFRWNPSSDNMLASGYGSLPRADTKTGVVLVWTVKNPSLPGRHYSFNSPVSDLDWNHSKPNLLAVGFYNGVIKIIDVSSKTLSIMQQTRRSTSPSYAPHWQVQWWAGEEQFNFEELLYTSNQDGRILCYRADKDFSSTEIMRISRIEGEIRGVKRTNHCSVYDIPITRNPAALLLQRHPESSTIYFVGSDEGCVHRCSTNYMHQHIGCFLAHDGPVYSLQFSPFCSKIFLTCGADWCTRIWADGITEPLITLFTQMACVRSAAWSPTISTVIACVVNDEICLWDIRRKTYVPASVTKSSSDGRLLLLEFTKNGNQLVVADLEGNINIYSLEGMPFPPFDQTHVLLSSIQKSLVTKPDLLRQLQKLGLPF